MGQNKAQEIKDFVILKHNYETGEKSKRFVWISHYPDLKTKCHRHMKTITIMQVPFDIEGLCMKVIEIWKWISSHDERFHSCKAFLKCLIVELIGPSAAVAFSCFLVRRYTFKLAGESGEGRFLFSSESSGDLIRLADRDM